MSDKKCKRCGDPTPSIDNLIESTFWGFIQHETKTTVEHALHVTAHYYRSNPKRGSSNLIADERNAICDDCWDLFIARFLQGRSTPAIPGKETW